jgi:hydroxyacylglutathione hydrolase
MSDVDFKTRVQNPEVPNAFDVDPEEVFSLKDQVRLVDVRRPDEYEGELGHAPGAQLMTLDTLPENISSLPKDETIVFICRSGGRSGRATGFALEKGFTKVYNMKGGMIAWNEKGLETEGKPS